MLILLARVCICTSWERVKPAILTIIITGSERQQSCVTTVSLHKLFVSCKTVAQYQLIISCFFLRS